MCIQPDSKECVIVAFSLLLYTYFATAVNKSSSVLYVGSMEMLGLSRESASWPVTLGIMFSQLAAPVYGLMLKHTSERFCLILGALCCSIPLMVSSYSENVVSLAVNVGVIQGFGTACSEVVPFVIIMRHFQKYRGSVISATYIISAVAGFLMPILYEFVRQTSGFRMCLFVMGVANLCMLLGCIVVSRIPEDDLEASFDSTSDASTSCSERSLLLSNDKNHCGYVDVESLQQRTPLLQSKSQEKSQDDTDGIFSISFLHITVSRAVTVFSLSTFLLILLDYSADRGIDAVHGVVVLTVFTIGDLVSRILAGCLVDLNVISHGAMMSLTFFLQALSYIQLIQCNVHVVILVSSFLIGLTGGCRNILSTMLVTENCEESKLGINLGVVNFATGILIFFQPLVIGFVRDSLGSYEPLLLTFVGCNFLLSFTWLWQVLSKPCQ